MLTREEKFNLLTGKCSWETDDCNGKIKKLKLCDGPHGLRLCNGFEGDSKATNTSYPSLSLLACSWDKELAYLMANSIADDYIDNNVDILLGPGINIKRSPLNGRNFEYFSEDPVLSGELASAYINGLQNKGIGACLKHFAVNCSENFRMCQNEELDERTLYEIYLKAFAIAIKKSKPWTVMASYNKVNGIYASENRRLLNDVLRGELGFDGVIVSDWGASQNRAKSLKASLDLEMPFNECSFEELKEAYNLGFITDNDIDSSVNRILDLIEKTKNSKKRVSFTSQQRHENAVKIAEESTVLLKNNGILPLKAGSTVDLFMGCDIEVYGGGGSSAVNSNVNIKSVADSLTDLGFKVNKSLSHENVICDFYGDYQIVTISDCIAETEGVDRYNIKLRHNDVLRVLDLAKKTDKLILLVYSGSAVDLSELVDKVAAIVYVGFAGEAGGEGVAKILSGKVNPSGKLAETFPVSIEQSSAFDDVETPSFRFLKERFYFGYRYYDKYNVVPQFPFGYGLSYSNFEYSDLRIEKTDDTDFDVIYDITNKSKVDGKEVSQIYVSDVFSTCDRPVKELKGFSKDEIKAGETKTVKIHLDKDAFSFYNPSLKSFYVENGYFDILVGSSSADIKLKTRIEINLDFYSQCSFNHGGWNRKNNLINKK